MTREQAERERLLDEFAYELAEQLKQRRITIKGAIREAFRQGEQSGKIEATPAAGWELEAAREIAAFTKDHDVAFDHFPNHCVHGRKLFTEPCADCELECQEPAVPLTTIEKIAAIIRKHAQGET